MYFFPFPEPASQSRIKLNKINWKRVPPVQFSVLASAFRDVGGKRTLHDLISLLLQFEHFCFDVWSFESFDFQTVRFTFPQNWRLIRFVRLTYNARVAVFNSRSGENMNTEKQKRRIEYVCRKKKKIPKHEMSSDGGDECTSVFGTIHIIHVPMNESGLLLLLLLCLCGANDVLFEHETWPNTFAHT